MQVRLGSHCPARLSGLDAPQVTKGVIMSLVATGDSWESCSRAQPSYVRRNLAQSLIKVVIMDQLRDNESPAFMVAFPLRLMYVADTSSLHEHPARPCDGIL